MQAKHHTDIVLLGIYNLFVIGIAEESQCNTVGTERRFDDIGDITFVCLLVKIIQALAGMILVLSEVIIGAVCNPPQLSPANGNRNSISVVALE